MHFVISALPIKYAITIQGLGLSVKVWLLQESNQNGLDIELVVTKNVKMDLIVRRVLKYR